MYANIAWQRSAIVSVATVTTVLLIGSTGARAASPPPFPTFDFECDIESANSSFSPNGSVIGHVSGKNDPNKGGEFIATISGAILTKPIEKVSLTVQEASAAAPRLYDYTKQFMKVESASGSTLELKASDFQVNPDAYPSGTKFNSTTTVLRITIGPKTNPTYAVAESQEPGGVCAERK
jgi:hypothetical protein